jgi:hypothetical protein
MDKFIVMNVYDATLKNLLNNLWFFPFFLVYE